MEFLQSGLMSMAAFIFVLTLVVYVHEMGHYIVARLNGVKVDEFSIGFGREIFGWTNKNGTRWKFSWIPLGGYVKLFGDADAASTGPQAKAEGYTQEEKSQMLHYKSVGARAAVAAAGPIVNFLFAIILFAGLFMFVGRSFSPPIIANIQPGSVAEKIMLKKGDIVTSIDGQKFTSFEDMALYIRARPTQEMSLNILRDDEKLHFSFTPQALEIEPFKGMKETIGVIGISGEGKWEKLSLPQAVLEGVKKTWLTIQNSFLGLGKLIKGEESTDKLSGPLGIYKITGQIAERSFIDLLSFMAFISIALGFVNLLPIPALDGGHLLFCLIEAVRGKPLNEKLQGYATAAGFAILIGILLISTWSDLKKFEIFAPIVKFFT